MSGFVLRGQKCIAELIAVVSHDNPETLSQPNKPPPVHECRHGSVFFSHHYVANGLGYLTKRYKIIINNTSHIH